MTGVPDDATEEERNDDAGEGPGEMKTVDHTHPDTDEPFTETGVYDRGKVRAEEAEAEEE